MEYQRISPFDDLKNFFLKQGLLQRFIIVNVAVWLLAQVSIVMAFLFKAGDGAAQTFIIDWLAVPSSFNTLVYRPWSPFSYMFLHVDFLHILFNLLWLYIFGRIFLQFLGDRQLFSTYVLGGLSGAFLYIIAYNVFPVFSEAVPFSHALGASAAVMAIVTTISFYAPNYTLNLIFVGKVRILYIAIILFVLDFFMITSDNSGGHIAHIGGAIYGFAYAAYLRKGIDFSDIFKRKRKDSGTWSYTQDTGNGRPMTDEQYNANRAEQNDRMDIILEKIKRSGYDSLTKEEKEFLFNASNRK